MEGLKLFLSYVEDDEGERVTDQLHNALSELHIGSVMAKHNINPGADWVETIRKHLCDSIALVCVATSGYSKSVWAQQEIGYALGRKLPVLWIRYAKDEVPLGFLAHQQALEPKDVAKPAGIADAVLRWLASNGQTSDFIADMLIFALEQSESYDDARALVKTLATLKGLTGSQWKRVEAAASFNRQVGNAVIWTNRHSVNPEDQPSAVEWLKTELSASLSEDSSD